MCVHTYVCICCYHYECYINQKDCYIVNKSQYLNRNDQLSSISFVILSNHLFWTFLTPSNHLLWTFVILSSNLLWTFYTIYLVPASSLETLAVSCSFLISYLDLPEAH